MDLNNLTPEQQQQVVLLLQQIQAQGSNTNAAEKIASAMQQQASTTLVENIKILAVLKLLSAHVQQPNQVSQEQPFVEGPQGLGSNNNAPIGDSSVLLQQILELKQQMINNPNDEGFGLQGQPPQQFNEHEFYNNNTRHDNGNYRREHNSNSPPRWRRDRDQRGDRDRRGSRERDREHHHSPPRRERSPAHHPPSSGRNRPPKWVRDQQRAERGSGTVPTQPPPIGQGAVFTAQNPTEILASYLTDEDVVIPKFSLMQPVITGISNGGNDNNHSGTPKRPRPLSVPAPETAPKPINNNNNTLPVIRPKGDGLGTSTPVPSPVKTSSGLPPPMVGKAPPNPKKMPSSPLKGPSTAPPNSSTKLPPPARKGPPLNSPQKSAKVSLEGIPPPYPPPKFPPKQSMHNTPAPVKAPNSQPQPMPPKQYGPKVNATPPPRTTFPPKQPPQSYPQPKPYHPPSHALTSHVQHSPYAQPQHYQHPVQHPPTQPTAQSYYQHPPPQVPNAAPTISPASSQGRDLFQEATVEDLQQVHQFLTEVLEIQQEAAKDKSRAAVSRVPPPQPGKPAQQVGPALPPQASSSYTPPQVKQPPLLNKRPAPTVDTPVALKKHKTDHYPPTPSPQKAPMTYPPSAQPVTPITMAPQAVPPQPMPYPPAAYPPGYQYPYPYPAYDYNAAYQYYYGAAYPPPGVAPTAPATYPPPGYYPAVPPGYPKK